VDWYRQAKDELKKAVLARFYDERLGRFVRSLIPAEVDGVPGLQADPLIDASMAGVWLFGMLPPDDRRVIPTMGMIYDRLWVKSPIGGLARYEDDYYFQVTSDVRNVPGNPWFISTLWMAEWYIAIATSIRDLEPARQLLEWTARHTSDAGLLAEQVHPFTGEPLSVMPLTWSHAAYVTAFLKYQAKVHEVSSSQAEPA
jgi:GH15 family glucan-1,4-alpha-glucosidase